MSLKPSTRFFCYFSISILLLVPGTASVFGQGAESRPNVLMIALDDLRPMLGCYGDERIQTPNIDRLAARGTVFEQAYCQSPQCGPSRVSLMTGWRPETTKTYSLRDHFNFSREKHPDLVTLPEHFMKHGYHALSFGKIYHDGRDDPASWSVPPQPGRDGEMLEIVDEAALAGVPFEKRNEVPTIIADREACPAWQSPEVPDDALFAGRMTNDVTRLLTTLKEKNQPFFLAVGYRRPHLPFVAPKKYFDLYPPSRDLLPTQTDPPKDAPVIGFYSTNNYAPAPGKKSRWGKPIPVTPATFEEALPWSGFELRSYQKVPLEGPIPEETVIELRRAYMACVTYADAQVGRLLDALEAEGLAENTVILLWADHGYHLGELATWTKMTNYEWAARVPLIVAGQPGRFQPSRSKALAELVDVYPTLCDLAGLPIPETLEGSSLVPVLEKPEREWKTAAFTEYPRKLWGHGRAIRTSRYRYVEWESEESGEIFATELYDHESDPGETVNIAEHEGNAELIQKLSQELKAGWKAHLPK